MPSSVLGRSQLSIIGCGLQCVTAFLLLGGVLRSYLLALGDVGGLLVRSLRDCSRSDAISFSSRPHASSEELIIVQLALS